MIRVENIEVWGFEHAIRGMRNPMNSWIKSDSEFVPWDETAFELGKSDLSLMQRLYKAGTEHRKYLRQIFVSMDITALYTGGKNLTHIRLVLLLIPVQQCILFTKRNLN